MRRLKNEIKENGNQVEDRNALLIWKTLDSYWVIYGEKMLEAATACKVAELPICFMNRIRNENLMHRHYKNLDASNEDSNRAYCLTSLFEREDDMRSAISRMIEVASYSLTEISALGRVRNLSEKSPPLDAKRRWKPHLQTLGNSKAQPRWLRENSQRHNIQRVRRIHKDFDSTQNSSRLRNC